MKKASLPVLHSWVDILRMWNFANAIRAVCSNYRILLIHLVQGQEAEAASTYQTMQETFGNNPYAAPYVEMASAFWKSYQPTKKMYDVCAEAIQFAVEHPEILVPLGSDYHGWQSHIYEPADVCLFR